MLRWVDKRLARAEAAMANRAEVERRLCAMFNESERETLSALLSRMILLNGLSSDFNGDVA